jgi:HAE1 family hydrophobic/amphiphilic exporter-1/multidrug efflux pump
VKTIGNLATAQEFNIIIRTDGATIVRLSDIGKQNLVPKNIETKLSQSGMPLIGLAIVPRPGANYLDISKSFTSNMKP